MLFFAFGLIICLFTNNRFSQKLVKIILSASLHLMSPLNELMFLVFALLHAVKFLLLHTINQNLQIMTIKYESCIEACQTCLVECQHCLSEMAGKSSMNDCPKCCVQCIDACYICIKMMACDSAFVKQYALLCAEICDYCADHCEAHDHEHCKACAVSCRKCAEECRKIAA